MSSTVHKLRESWESNRQSRPKRQAGFDLVVHPFDKKLFGTTRHQEKYVPEINSSGFRCDNFKKEHDGLHILFSGCSTTYGTGLSIEDIWAHKVYSKISESQKVSGYYNLGVPGTGLFLIVSNIFKYFEQYGNPDVIFINLPDMFRHYAIDDLNLSEEEMKHLEIIFSKVSKNVYNKISDNEPHSEDVMSLWPIYYDYLLMLESYCKTNNIELFAFSYSPPTNAIISQTDINRFFPIEPTQIADEIVEFVSNNDVDKHFVTAEDGMHEGHGFHTLWASKIIDFYFRGKNVN
jgi:hypothetical protein